MVRARLFDMKCNDIVITKQNDKFIFFGKRENDGWVENARRY